MITRFEVGTTYATEDGIHVGTIVRRTDKTVWVKSVSESDTIVSHSAYGVSVKKGRFTSEHIASSIIHIENGVETAKPWGKWAGAPKLLASHEC